MTQNCGLCSDQALHALVAQVLELAVVGSPLDRPLPPLAVCAHAMFCAQKDPVVMKRIETERPRGAADALERYGTSLFTRARIVGPLTKGDVVLKKGSPWRVLFLARGAVELAHGGGKPIRWTMIGGIALGRTTSDPLTSHPECDIVAAEDGTEVWEVWDPSLHSKLLVEGTRTFELRYSTHHK